MTPKRKLYVIEGGFIFVGEPAQHTTEGWTQINNASVVRSYSGGKGIGGVTSGEDKTVVFDKVPEPVEVPIRKIIFVTEMSI